MPPPGRRLKFTLLVLASQVLLIALALAWTIHMTLIAANGSVYFVENNPVILWIEIIASVLISLFGTAVFAIQVYRLGERRRSDDTRNERRRNDDIRDERRRADDVLDELRRTDKVRDE
jgi:membrane protein implicated in regulation of membrane protease activity